MIINVRREEYQSEVDAKSHSNWITLGTTYLGESRLSWDTLEIWKSWKFWKSWFLACSGSQNTVLELQSAAPRRKVQITCRGEVSNSVSNTPPGQNRRGPHPDFTIKFGRFFLNFSRSLNSFYMILSGTRDRYQSEVHAKSHSNWITLGTTYLGETRLSWDTPKYENHENPENHDFQPALALKTRFWSSRALRKRAMFK